MTTAVVGEHNHIMNEKHKMKAIKRPLSCRGDCSPQSHSGGKPGDHRGIILETIGKRRLTNFGKALVNLRDTPPCPTSGRRASIAILSFDDNIMLSSQRRVF